jgi:branched-chain amino acid transport system permease protein
MNYYLHIIIIIEIYIILTLSLNIQFGFTGLLNLSMGVFYGIGAYLYAIFRIKAGFSFIPACLMAIIGNMVFSLFISLTSVRFKGSIFIIASIAFQSIIYTVLDNWREVTGGSYGISNIPRPNFFGINIITVPQFAIFSTLILLLIILFSKFIYSSAFGRTLQAIRDNEIFAETLGKNLISFKVQSVALGAGIASFAGIIYASYITYIEANCFSINESIDIVFILILGGLANIRGSIIGTIIFILSQEVFKMIGFSNDIAFNLRNILFAVCMILILYYKPKGVTGKLSL